MKLNSFCVGDRHQSAALSIEVNIIETGQNLMIGNCVHCNGKKSNGC